MKQFHQWLKPSTWTIRTKLSVALLAVALVPMGFTTYYNLQESLQKVRDSEYHKLELLAVSNASRLEQLITDIQRVVVQVSTEQSVVKFLAAAQQDANPANVQRSLDNVFRSNPDSDAVYLLNRQGRCITSTDPTFVGQSYKFWEYFQQAIQGRPYISGVIIDVTSRKPGIYFSSPVRTSDGSIVGVAVLKIKGEEIQAIVSKMQSGNQSNAFLIDQQGVIIAHPDRSILYHSLAPLPPAQHHQAKTNKLYSVDEIESLDAPTLAKAMIGAEEPGHTSYYSAQEQMSQMVGFAPLEMQPWVLGIVVPQTQFKAPLHHLIGQSLIGFVILGVIAAAIAISLARSIAKPIRAMTKAAQALVDQDEIDSQQLIDASRSPDDTGQLARIFLQMIEEIKAREQRFQQQLTEIDEVKKARQVAEITGTHYFQELQKKARKLKKRSANETDYLQRLQQQAKEMKRGNQHD